MKKLISLILISMLLLCSTGLTLAVAATSETDNNAPNATPEQGTLYLVPGANNTISSGAEHLTQQQCDEIFVDNAYICTLGKGATLPTPESDRVDKEGNPFSFNGWWSIVDATITYFDKVPEISETMFLYADWRADLSQKKDPVQPNESTAHVNHYMTIKRAATGETETLVLRVGGTDMRNAETLGYGGPVQLYNDWFELSKGDVITVYTKGLGADKDKTQVVPLLDDSNSRSITLESSGDGLNVTANFLSKDEGSQRRNPTLTCIAETSRHYRIYIKFYYGGANMAVYMEQMD